MLFSAIPALAGLFEWHHSGDERVINVALRGIRVASAGSEATDNSAGRLHCLLPNATVEMFVSGSADCMIAGSISTEMIVTPLRGNRHHALVGEHIHSGC